MSVQINKTSYDIRYRYIVHPEFGSQAVSRFGSRDVAERFIPRSRSIQDANCVGQPDCIASTSTMIQQTHRRGKFQRTLSSYKAHAHCSRIEKRVEALQTGDKVCAASPEFTCLGRLSLQAMSDHANA